MCCCSYGGINYRYDGCILSFQVLTRVKQEFTFLLCVQLSGIKYNCVRPISMTLCVYGVCVCTCGGQEMVLGVYWLLIFEKGPLSEWGMSFQLGWLAESLCWQRHLPHPLHNLWCCKTETLSLLSSNVLCPQAASKHLSTFSLHNFNYSKYLSHGGRDNTSSRDWVILWPQGSFMS